MECLTAYVQKKKKKDALTCNSAQAPFEELQKCFKRKWFRPMLIEHLFTLSVCDSGWCCLLFSCIFFDILPLLFINEENSRCTFVSK